MQTTVFSMSANGALEQTQPADLQIGQIIWLNGYGQSQHDHERKAIYEVTNPTGSGITGKRYKWVNLNKPERGVTDAYSIRHSSKIFGIGTYYDYNDIATDDEIADAMSKAIAQEEINKQAKQAAQLENNRLADIGRKLIADNMPMGSVAMIVAQLKEDDSDPYTDYFNSKTVRTVLLAFSSSDRNNFAEMRKAATLFDPIQCYGTGKDIYKVYAVLSEDLNTNGSYYRRGLRSPWHKEIEKEVYTHDDVATYINSLPALEPLSFDGKAVAFEYDYSKTSVEQRDSFGDGYHLGQGGRSGWIVKKLPINQYIKSLYSEFGKEGNFIAFKSGNASTGTVTPSGTDQAEIRHNKQQEGIEIHFAFKPEQSVIDDIKTSGFRWAHRNKCWYKKINAGAVKKASKYGTIPDTLKHLIAD